MKHEDGDGSAFVSRPNANLVSVDGCRDAGGVPRSRQRMEAGQSDID